MKKTVLRRIIAILGIILVLGVSGVSTVNTFYASSGLTELESKATDTISEVQAVLVRVCLAIFPLSLIACLALMLFTHDDRKISGYVKICVTICIVTALILLVNSGAVLAFIKDIIGM